MWSFRILFQLKRQRKIFGCLNCSMLVPIFKPLFKATVQLLNLHYSTELPLNNVVGFYHACLMEMMVNKTSYMHVQNYIFLNLLYQLFLIQTKTRDFDKFVEGNNFTTSYHKLLISNSNKNFSCKQLRFRK
jgi:hypothetical protein